MQRGQNGHINSYARYFPPRASKGPARRWRPLLRAVMEDPVAPAAAYNPDEDATDESDEKASMESATQLNEHSIEDSTPIDCIEFGRSRAALI